MMLIDKTEDFGKYASVNKEWYFNVIETYMYNYYQKELRYIDDGIYPEEIMQRLSSFGIKTDKIEERVHLSTIHYYILFINSPEFFDNKEVLAKYITEYKKEFLPNDALLTHIILQFPINSYEERTAYMQMLENTLEVFNLNQDENVLEPLISYSFKSESKVIPIEGVDFDKIHLFRYEDLGQILLKMNTALNIEQKLEILVSELDNYYYTFLQGKVLQTETHQSADNNIGYYYKYCVAYLDTTYELDIYYYNFSNNTQKGIVVGREIEAVLPLFYCNYSFFTGYDKIKFLLEYPTLVYNNKYLLDFFFYIPKDTRTFIITIQYLENDNVITEDINVYDYQFTRVTEQNMRALVQLEDNLDNKFLNIKNTIMVRINDKEKLAYLKSIDPVFKCSVISVNNTNYSFIKELNLQDLITSLSLSKISFKPSLEEPNITCLTLIQDILSEVKGIVYNDISDENKFYTPEYAKDGKGMLFYFITSLEIVDKLVSLDSNELIYQLYFITNYIMCERGIENLYPMLSVSQLRHNSTFSYNISYHNPKNQSYPVLPLNSNKSILSLYGISRPIDIKPTLFCTI